MADAVRIAVPDDLAQELTRDGLSEVKRVRGVDAQTILTIAGTAVGVAGGGVISSSNSNRIIQLGGRFTF